MQTFNQLFDKADTELEVATNTAAVLSEYIDDDCKGFVLLGIMDKIESAKTIINQIYCLYKKNEKGGDQ